MRAYRMKILIIGAGWYGCHLALSLKERNVSVDLIDKEPDIFLHAASKNQRRLHLGFHYPRSYKTREQSKHGFLKFIQKYPNFSHEVKNNFYAIDNVNSNIDAETYKIIMENSGVEFNTVENFQNKFTNIDQLFVTKERRIDIEYAQKFFKSNLKEILKLNTNLNDINTNNYDYIINCTYGAIPSKGYELKYEAHISFLLKKKIHEEFSLTVVDGQFFSLYPYINDLYSFTSVKHGVISTETTYDNAQLVLNKMTAIKAKALFNLAIEESKTYYPKIQSDFSFNSYFTTVRVKPIYKTDSREVAVIKNKNIITVLSGKIDAIFTAEEKVLNILGV